MMFLSSPEESGYRKLATHPPGRKTPEPEKMPALSTQPVPFSPKSPVRTGE